ncbi:LemA family protein [Methylococcus sp. EFPC2]|uniref:LemA family protein n=1 Tax=Methylococcus sp. EFPC2 TaxID=2812648 RepID=UPI00196802AA|nr:LemA family protein [Methylococcus sp. EFPC2]QSA96279.1 LemA family protein [Methylococcus sp. EFPC2]
MLSVGGFVLLGMLVVLSLYVIVIYNRFVSLKHDTAKAWANIDVLLKQRHDELPKLVETCKQYMKHERETLERVMQARAGVSAAREASNLPALGAAEGQLRRGLLQLFAVAEAYPDLKADTAFRNLEARITGLENAIADRREFYNDTVNNNNVRLEQFPDVIIARLFAFKPFQLLEFSDEEKQDVDLRALFS